MRDSGIASIRILWFPPSGANCYSSANRFVHYEDAERLRQLGITCYGWAPIYTTVEENEGVHGNNERITVQNIREGTREMYEVVSRIAH